ncbi:MAG TPA: transcription antitermination factor NusB [Actinomycetota bacterium]|nr:transcription antitermination factor NusB [Actinomycetota bacterium]
MDDRPEPPPRQGGRVGHRRRRRARRTAIEILFQADLTGRPPSEVLASWREAGRHIPPYTEELVLGVERELPEIDRWLGETSREWPVHRMAAVDRTILRVATRELRAGLPVPVAIDEAVEAANELSTEESGRFVNGVLARIARRLKGPERDEEPRAAHD